MKTTYLEFNFTVKPYQPGTEILIAQLAEINFESFVETQVGVKAYIQKDQWNNNLDELQILQSNQFDISFISSEISQINWNAAWEKNFHPIEVNNKCIVRAPFHSPTNFPYEIIIEPKMSFGTGHHETTFMMLQYVLENELADKTVLDMGCGTAVLAILAEMRGASKIDAIDIDVWCFENSLENTERNHCKNIFVHQGDASLLKNKKYDVIFANINRNILLKDIPAYAESLNKFGSIYFSGFYEEDLPLIKELCTKFDLIFVDSKENNNWIAAKFIKN
ncbi:MAG: 50S ribosomal protein L11 methyltransferase [Flavobacteriales bacterium]